MKHLQQYQHHWNRLVRNVGAAYACSAMDQPTYEKYYEFLEQFGPSIPVRNVYDIGCGAGRIIPVVRKFWPDALYHGFDVSAEMVEYCQDTWTGCAFETINRFEQIVRGKAEFIIVHSVFTHIFLEDAEDLLDAIRLSLAPGGTASISIHIDIAEGHKDSVGRTDWEPNAFIALMARHGLRITGWLDALQRYYRVEAME